jgi:hypothetical protein
VEYKTPKLTKLGSLSELTLGNNGSVPDMNGRGTHKQGQPG